MTVTASEFTLVGDVRLPVGGADGNGAVIEQPPVRASPKLTFQNCEPRWRKSSSWSAYSPQLISDRDPQSGQGLQPLALLMEMSGAWLVDKTCKTLILLEVRLALAKPNKTPVTVGFRSLNPTYKSNFCQSVKSGAIGATLSPPHYS